MSASTRVAVWGAALLAVWGAVVWLRPLGDLLPGIRQMAATTTAILDETRELQAGAGKVQLGLRGLQRQEKLLEEQEQLTRSLLGELGRQQQLGTDAAARLQEILETERSTVELTRQADRASAATLQTVKASAAEIERLVAAAGSIEPTSHALDRQMDRLLTELEGSAANFAVVGQLKEAAGMAADRSTSWWDHMWEWWPWKKR